MVKFNEALLVGISLLAALVLSKGSSILSRSNSISFINPYTSQLSEAQAQAIQKGESNIETLQNIKESNLGIAQDILDYERNIANTKIDYLQTELSKTQAFISQEQKFKPASLFGLASKGWTGKEAVNKWKSTYDWAVKGWTGEKGPLNQISLFPDVYIPLNQSTLSNFKAQARYEEAQERISEANQLIFRQQAEIDRLEEEYQTRFGGLSRYG